MAPTGCRHIWGSAPPQQIAGHCKHPRRHGVASGRAGCTPAGKLRGGLCAHALQSPTEPDTRVKAVLTHSAYDPKMHFRKVLTQFPCHTLLVEQDGFAAKQQRKERSSPTGSSTAEGNRALPALMATSAGERGAPKGKQQNTPPGTSGVSCPACVRS